MKNLLIALTAVLLPACSLGGETADDSFNAKIEKTDKNAECLEYQDDIEEIVENSNAPRLSAGAFVFEKLFYSPKVDSCVYLTIDLNGDGKVRSCWLRDVFTNEDVAMAGAGSDSSDCWYENDFPDCQTECNDLMEVYYFE